MDQNKKQYDPLTLEAWISIVEVGKQSCPQTHYKVTVRCSTFLFMCNDEEGSAFPWFKKSDQFFVERRIQPPSYGSSPLIKKRSENLFLFLVIIFECSTFS
jgi:hypothetical protein